jgi:hypothetical protein
MPFPRQWLVFCANELMNVVGLDVHDPWILKRSDHPLFSMPASLAAVLNHALRAAIVPVSGW